MVRAINHAMAVPIITQRITKPLKLLGEGIKEIKKGNLDVQIPIADTRLAAGREGKTGDELASLAFTFNDMVKALKQRLTNWNLLKSSFRSGWSLLKYMKD